MSVVFRRDGWAKGRIPMVEPQEEEEKEDHASQSPTCPCRIRTRFVIQLLGSRATAIMTTTKSAKNMCRRRCPLYETRRHSALLPNVESLLRRILRQQRPRYPPTGTRATTTVDMRIMRRRNMHPRCHLGRLAQARDHLLSEDPRRRRRRMMMMMIIIIMHLDCHLARE